MNICIFCRAGMHFICLSKLLDNLCCCAAEESSTQEQSLPSLNLGREEREPSVIVKRKPGRPKKVLGEFTNQLAAGRKRATREFKIEEGTICEWAWKKENGGGIVPVMGCSGRTAKHIHHGPDKSVLNNDRQTNISIVCTFCHQLWHARNDKFYHGERPNDGREWTPTGGVTHRLDESEPATVEEVVTFEIQIDRDMNEDDWERISDRRLLETNTGTKVRSSSDES